MGFGSLGRLPLAVCAAAVCCVCPGCLVCSSATVGCGDKGPPPDAQALARIEPGKTTKASVVSTLGKPTRVESGDGGREVLVYEYVRKEEASLAVFVVWASSATNEKHRTLYVEVEDGVVKRYWEDS